MTISIFDLFTVGIGPSSSHTVGPMRACGRFVDRLRRRGLLDRAGRVKVELFGSLGLTGKAHGTDTAIVLGLLGERPETIDPSSVTDRLASLVQVGEMSIGGRRSFVFDARRDLVFHRRKSLPQHSNGMRFRAYAGDRKTVIEERVYYSVGGGFVVDEETAEADRLAPSTIEIPHPFASGHALMERTEETGLAIHDLVLENECMLRHADDVRHDLLDIWRTMRDCVSCGCRRCLDDYFLPGPLDVTRRAPALYRRLLERPEALLKDPLTVLDWVNLYALAVGEENASGGRVVTAPTNGAAGIVPAVLHYYANLAPGATEEGVLRFLLTAGAVGILFKENASISGAEVGCQGEVGVACSMAAAGLAAALGATPPQVENAAEIGMEHNLGLTCDPVGGLVQIPCIERNAMGAVKAINAARIALRGDGFHKVSLDKVIATMRQTGADMKKKYKETSKGGLAINVIVC